MLAYLLYGLFILSCIVLVIAVLLQPGKADAGALFTSSVSSTAFGPRGTASVLAKITIAAAVSFMLIALILSMGIGEPRSVMEGGGAAPKPQASPATSTTPQTNASPGANATDGAATVPPAANTATATPAPAASPNAQASPAR